MIKKLILAIVAVVFIALGVVMIMAAMQENTFAVTRTAEISAPAATVFDKVNDFNNWPKWSPWEALDPNMKRTISTLSAGEGATYAWVGNSQAGEGKMTIVESHSPSHVGIKLDFIKPMEATNKTDISFKEANGKTNVTWKMSGDKNFLMKVMCVFMDIDKMIGDDFDRGLSQLKSVSESSAPVN